MAWSTCWRRASRDCGGGGRGAVVVDRAGAVPPAAPVSGLEGRATSAATAASSEPLSISSVPFLSPLQSFRGTAYCLAREQSSSARGSGGIEGVPVGEVEVVEVEEEARRDDDDDDDDGEEESCCAAAKFERHGSSRTTTTTTTNERRETPCL